MAFGFKSDEGASTSRGDFDVRPENMKELRKGGSGGRFTMLKDAQVGEFKINYPKMKVRCSFCIYTPSPFQTWFT